MQYLTWGQIKREVQKDHGIEGDPDYDETELVNMANRAINRVESRVIQQQQDYFLDKIDIAVTNGTTEYTLPDDIYAYKIRRVFWIEDGYLPKRMYRATNIDDMELRNTVSDYYGYDKKLRYMILNDAITGPRITLSYSNVDATMRVYYTRNANRFNDVDGDGQVCDIPEFADAVIAYMKYLVELKDKSPTLAATKQDYIDIMEELTSSLGVAVNDEDMMIEPDTEIYDDHE